jgi:hypothetical protein
MNLFDILSSFLFYIEGRELSYKGLSLSTTTLKSTSSPKKGENMNDITNKTGSVSIAKCPVTRLHYSYFLKVSFKVFAPDERLVPLGMSVFVHRQS